MGPNEHLGNLPTAQRDTDEPVGGSFCGSLYELKCLSAEGKLQRAGVESQSMKGEANFAQIWERLFSLGSFDSASGH